MKKLVSILLSFAVLISVFALSNTAALARANRLARPGIPTATVTGTGRIRVNYRQMRGSNRAQIQIRRVGARNWRTININLRNVTRNTARNRVIRGLSNERYQVRVRARRVVRGQRTVNSSWSRVRTFRLRPGTPARPNVSVNNRTATLRWTRVAGATGYRIQRRVGAGSWITAANVGSNVTSRNFTLSATNAYSFRIIALGRGGNSAPSPAITGVRAQVPPTTQPPTTQPPTTPPFYPPNATPARYFEYEPFGIYQNIGGHITLVTQLRITDFVGTHANVVIPSRIGGRNVVIIDTDAFRNNAAMTAVTIPNTVHTINTNAFRNTGLTSVVIPNSVNIMGAGAFRDNANLSAVTLSSSLTNLPSEAFLNTALASVNIPNSVRVINANAFRNTALQSVTIPSSVLTIGDSAFNDNTGLTAVTFAGTPTNLPETAFANTGLRYGDFSYTFRLDSGNIGVVVNRYNGADSQVTIPGVIAGRPVTAIAAGLFQNNTNLTSITVPNSVRDIRANAFNGAVNLREINLPSGALTIAASAFTGVELRSGDFEYSFSNSGEVTITRYTGTDAYVTVPAVISGRPVRVIGVEGSGVFAGHTALESVVISYGIRRVTSIAGMPNLTSVTLPNSVTHIGHFINPLGGGGFGHNPSLTSITLPESLTAIGIRAFSHSALETIHIPGSVEVIPANAFYSATSLHTVTLGQGVRRIEERAFAETGNLITISFPPSINFIHNNGFPNSGVRNGWVRFYGNRPSMFPGYAGAIAPAPGWGTPNHAKIYAPAGNNTWTNWHDFTSGRRTNIEFFSP